MTGLDDAVLGAATQQVPAASVVVEDQARIEQLSETVAQLSQALESRVVIEQAKGVLMERFRLSVNESFALLRYSARSSRSSLHGLAGAVVASGDTPVEVVHGLARQDRWRAIFPPA